jgi:butyrate kinase
MAKKLYAVMSLCKDLVYTDQFTKKENILKITGVAGFIACYETIEEAEKASCNGKFKIMIIKT